MDSTELRRIVEIVVRTVLRSLHGTGSVPTSSCAVSTKPQVLKGDVLALFTGSSAGLDHAVSALKKVDGAGYGIAGLFSSAAQRVPGIPGDPHGWGMVSAGPAEFPDHWATALEPFRLVVLPTLTRTSAAKLALGITDTPVTEAVYTALSLGRPVVAVTDGITGSEAPPEAGSNVPYVSRLNGAYLDRLKDLGVRLAPADRLAEEMLRALRGQEQGGEVIRGLVTEEDLKGISGPEILIEERSIITPLAQDRIRERSLRIRWVPRQP